ncbi:hypothetical protein [Dietzia cinnamea]|uniref:Uncharacterized protein n=3 Tax=Dietzia cinnamea TaxID=321318 RepID=A0A4R3ZSJ6_9ACTN|nr:hypothetical protein [Dietzia cinnamea]MCT2098946.1 hypothetical protein [Dietzia cinnamea]MCT2265208.1 hypothetical protein [Dietzia cinnamea]TCW23165.1 hypothetical protein EDD19_11593 [Dietzia cinnamea]
MASPDQRAQFELLAPLLAREGVDVWTATVADLDAGMERAKQRHAAAVARVRAVLDAHARDDISAAGALLEELELTAETTPPPIPDALTVATRFAQLAQTLAPQLPADVIGAVKDRARVADAPEGMADLCEAVLLDCDAATGIRTVVREHGPAAALYAAAAMTAAVFSRWAAHTGDSMDEVVAAHA